MKVRADVEAWTDGACEPNPGVGGLGVVLVRGGRTIELAEGPYLDTTNNQMEMLAVIRALDFLHRRIGPMSVLVMTDSQYVLKGITEWIDLWKKRGWTTANGKQVKNAPLWEQLEAARQRHRMVAFDWVKGHAGNVHNERADQLASAARINACARSTRVTQ